MTDLLARLADAPHAFGFYQAMRRLEAVYRDRPRFGRSTRPAQDAVRLGQEASMVFAPSTLAAWEGASEHHPPRLLVHFFGLFGPNGALPLHLTEYVRGRRQHAGDIAMARFADIFHHRALSLFYRAWADAQPTVSFDRPEDDRFATYVGSLFGLGMASLRDRDAMPDLAKLHFAGHFAAQTRHPEGLAAILSTFFTMPVRIESFIGAWLGLQQEDRSRLGARREVATLGDTAVLGTRIWSRQHKFRIVFGPLDLTEYLRLLPGGPSLHRLLPIVRNYAGDVLVWDVNLILKRAQVPPLQLGCQGRLGWTTWLGHRREADDADDLHLDASADSLVARIDAAALHPPSSHRTETTP